jgi:hypothetical protein
MGTHFFGVDMDFGERKKEGYVLKFKNMWILANSIVFRSHIHLQCVNYYILM